MTDESFKYERPTNQSTYLGHVVGRADLERLEGVLLRKALRVALHLYIYIKGCVCVCGND